MNKTRRRNLIASTVVLILLIAMPGWAHRDNSPATNFAKMSGVTVTDNGNLGASYVGANAILNPDRTANPQTSWTGGFHSRNRTGHNDLVTLTITFPQNVTFDHIAWNTGSVSGDYWKESGFTPTWSASVNGTLVVNNKPMDTGGASYYKHDPCGPVPGGDQHESASFEAVTGNQIVLQFTPISRAGGYYWSARDINVSYVGSETFYDFVANATDATWSNPMQGVTYGYGSEQGLVIKSSGMLEDAKNYSTFLNTYPDWRSDVFEHYIRGSYTVTIPNDVTDCTFHATVGFLPAALTTGVTYRLLLNRYGQWTTLCSTTKQCDGILASMTASLSGYQGETLNLYLETDALGSSANDWSVWRKAYITVESPIVIQVRNYGAIPDDGVNDNAAIQNAINAATGVGQGAMLVFESGIYNLNSQLSISGAADGIILKGVSGTQFITSNRDSGILFASNSGNVTMESITIDYNPLPFTQGTIAIKGSNYIVLNLDSGYPQLDTDSWLGVTDGSVAVIINDPNIPGRVKANCATYQTITSWTKLAPGQFKIYLNGTLSGVAVGDRVVPFRRQAANWGLSLSNCPNGHILFKNINMYSQSSMSYVAGGVERVFLRDCNTSIKPSTTRLKGPNGDAVHMQNCKNGPEIVNCLFEGQSDDGGNFYAIPYAITTRYADNHYLLNTGGRQLCLNDTLVFFRPSTGTLLGRAVVTGISGADITIDPAIAGVLTTDEACDMTWMSQGFLVANSTYRNFRGVGVRANTANGMFYNNTFTGLSDSAISLVNLEYVYVQGLQAQNTMIQGNSFNQCCLALEGVNNWFYDVDGSTLEYVGSPVTIAGMANNNKLASDKIHNNITIKGNTFNDWPLFAIYCGSSAFVNIQDNVMTNTTNTPKMNTTNMGIMYFNNSTGVSVTDNQVTDSRPSNRINGKLFAKRMDSSKIAASGNSYTIPNNSSLPELTWPGGTILSWSGNGTVTGTVTDSATGLAISGVYVQLAGTTYAATTGSNGTYIVSSVPTGGISSFYSMLTAYPGYYPKYSPINMAPTTNTKNVAIVPVNPAWEFTLGIDSWTSWNNLTTATSSGEIWSATITGSDPYCGSLSGMGLTTRASDSIRISMKISGGGTGTGRFGWYNTTNPSTLYSIPFTVYGDNAWHVYTIPVGTNANWLGTISQFRLDPIDGSQYTNQTVQIDYIRMLSCQLIAEKISDLLGKSDGTSIYLTKAIVTALFKDNLFYVEDESRVAGIAVTSLPSLPEVVEGQRVSVEGAMTTVNGHRMITATKIFGL